MEGSYEDVDSYRFKHESEKEWRMRRQFLLTHRDKFSDSRLRCLSSCYINVECYGCCYPAALMRQLAELTAELPRNSAANSSKWGFHQPVEFVPAGRRGN